MLACRSVVCNLHKQNKGTENMASALAQSCSCSAVETRPVDPPVVAPCKCRSGSRKPVQAD